jgi:hypothetical protein
MILIAPKRQPTSAAWKHGRCPKRDVCEPSDLGFEPVLAIEQVSGERGSAHRNAPCETVAAAFIGDARIGEHGC